MFKLNICSNPTCKHNSLSQIDTVNGLILEENGYCIDHTPNREQVEQEIIEYIKKNEKIVGLNASGLNFHDMDISGKKFYGCNFHNCSFSNIHSENCRFRMSFLDFAVFSDCNLIESNIQFSSFAGATLSIVLFTNSDLVHNNFCGINSYQSSFDDSDLYNSRFIGASLHNTSFRNCNIKNTNFANIYQENVSFKLSNTRAAFFQEGEFEQ